MLTDNGDERTRPDPRARGRRGIEIVDRTAGRVDPVGRVARSAIGALRDRLIELSVRDAGECPALIDHARERIRKRRMPDAVEHDRADGHLSGIRLTPRLGRDKARKQKGVKRRCRVADPDQAQKLGLLPPAGGR